MSNRTDLLFGPAVDTVKAIAEGQYSSVEVVEAHLERIEKVNPSLNAVVTLAAEQAMDEVRQADEKRSKREVLGPLHGLPIISGADWRDPIVMPVPLGSPDDVSIPTLRVAFHADNGLWPPHPDVAAAAQRAAKALADSGARVEESVPDALADMGGFYTEYRTADGGWTLVKLLDRVGTSKAGDALQQRIDSAEGIDTRRMTEVMMEVDCFKSRMLTYIRDFDAIVSPTCPHPPWKHGAGVNANYEEWTYGGIYNLLGWPAIVVRAGTSAEGLPVGVQIVGQPWREDVILALASEVEKRCGGYQRPDI